VAAGDVVAFAFEVVEDHGRLALGEAADQLP
jgi:hypothetical protein